MNLSSHWSPFTANKNFNQNPRMLASAKGMYWKTTDDRDVLDMTAGLWCCNLGHAREEVAQAMYQSAVTLDYAPSFGFGHNASFELAERLVKLMPGKLDHVFFTNSGSESVDTALKMAIAYHRSRGESSRTIMIGRERAYHGVNYGGTSVGGIPFNNQIFGRWQPSYHLPDVLDLEQNAFSKGLPDYGAEKAQQLESFILFHGPENIAAVIAEPIQGAGGVILPPKGYLHALREICDRYGVLLILDKVVCAFGRTGSFTASQEFNVQPDIMTTAKGLTSGVVPMGAVFCSRAIYSSIVTHGSAGIEFPHGYTYFSTSHRLCCR